MSTVFHGSLDFVIDADVFEKENVAQRLLEAFHTPDMQMPEAFKHHEPNRTIMDCVKAGELDTEEVSFFIDAYEVCRFEVLPLNAHVIQVGFSIHDAGYSTVEEVAGFLNGPLYKLAYPGYPIVMTDDGGFSGPQLYPKVDIAMLDTIGVSEIPDAHKHEQQRLYRFVLRKLMATWSDVEDQFYSPNGVPAFKDLNTKLCATFLAAANEAAQVRRNMPPR